MKKIQVLIAIALSIPMMATAQEVPSLEKLQAACRAIRPDVKTSEADAQRKNCELEAEMIVLKAQLAKATKPVPTPPDAAMMARLERDVAALKAEKEKNVAVEKKQEPEKPAPVVRPQLRYGMGMPMLGSGMPAGAIVPKFGSNIAATWVIPGMESYIGVVDIPGGVAQHNMNVVPGEMRMLVYKHGQQINVALPGPGNMPVSYMPVLARIDAGSPKLYQGGIDPIASRDVFVSATKGETITLVILTTTKDYIMPNGQQVPLWEPFLRLTFTYTKDGSSPQIFTGERGDKVWR